MNPPFLVAAVFCERTLQERDGVNSLIRLIDKIFVEHVVLPDGVEAMIPMNLFIAMKSGGYAGKARLTLKPLSPAGRKMKVNEIDIELPKDPQGGINLIVQAEISLREQGVYWFEIYFNDELATRTPLEVQLLQTQTQTQTPQPSPDESRK